MYAYPFAINIKTSTAGSAGRDESSGAANRSAADSTVTATATVTVSVTANDNDKDNDLDDDKEENLDSGAMNSLERDQCHQQPRREDWEERRTQPSSETTTMSNSNSHNVQVGRHSASNPTASSSQPASAIRRIRHSEVVLVDDVVYMYSNYWLRLTWPGSKGGFAGYVCLMAHTNTIRSPLDAGGRQTRLQEPKPKTGGGEFLFNYCDSLFCSLLHHP